ncbi:MAG: GntR family transcriptional regulator [Pseudomonadota bacterium]
MKPLQDKPDLADEAYGALRDAILDGDLPPGAPLAQAELALRLGVSRQPVHQALALLRREGLAVQRGRRGLEVAPFEPERVRRIYEVRAALEGLAASLAAARAPELSMAPEAFALEAHLAAGEAALVAGVVGDMIAADLAFHRAVYALSGNPEIERAAAGLWPHVRRAMSAVLRAEGEGARIRSQSWREHREIAEAIRTGDADRAEAVARAHCLASGAATARRLATVAAAD